MKTTTTFEKWDRVEDPKAPIHEHVCPDGHKWACDSPYCKSINALCSEHGGKEPPRAAA